jgi:hypothetical protein
MRCWNADEFEGELTKLFRASDQMRAVLEQLAPKPNAENERKALQERVKFWLECHTRDFCLDHLLASLNWQLSPSLDPQEYITANLVIEQSPDADGRVRIRDELSERSRRMDYLGHDRATDEPLVVVEAKRPSVSLPGTTPSLASPDAHDAGRVIAKALEKLKAGEEIPKRLLNGDWREAIVQVRNYCRTIKEARNTWPRKAVLSNGDWLINFANPENAFGSDTGAEIQPHLILVFESRSRMLQHHTLLWGQLEYSTLGTVDRRILVGQVGFVADPTMLETCSHGVRVSYTVKSGNFRRAPLLSVSPVLFVRGRGGGFVQVASSFDLEIPIDRDASITEHIRAVREAGQSLKRQLEDRVLGGRTLDLVTVQSHCADPGALRLRPVVQVLSHPDGEGFLLLTGEASHFILEADEFANCPHHRFASSRADGVAQQTGPLLESVLDPKSYLIDGSPHHCTHREVFAIKREQVTEANRERCGHRGMVVGGAFCGVWRFEQFLCCRSCVFHPVCVQAQAFSLPCRDRAPVTVRGQPLQTVAPG